MVQDSRNSNRDEGVARAGASSLSGSRLIGSGTATRLERMWRFDIPASLVVFLVALPLSIGIAMASNAPVLAGLIAAIVGGVVAGSIGGSPLQVSGPSATLTVVVAGLIAEFGWAVTCAVTAAAGLLQILFGLSRISRAALAISPMVVHAMMAGIGLTIALQQVNVLLGGSSRTSAWDNLFALPAELMDVDVQSAVIGLLVIAIVVSWRWVPAAVRRIPGPLAAIVTVSAVSVVLPFSVPRVTLDGSLMQALQLPSLPDGNWKAVAVGVLTIALISSIESLLSAVAVDRMHSGPRSNLDRALIGQGAANFVSGGLGGLPLAGVVVRSSANVAAGAKTRASSVLHGVWVLVFALPFVVLVEQIPTAALAGLLIVVGAQLVKRAHIETALRVGDLSVYTLTVVVVVFRNLLEGVLVGVAAAVALTLWRVVRARIQAEPAGPGKWNVTIEGSCTFLSLPRLSRVLAAVPTGSDVTLIVSIDYLDHASHQAIGDWRQQQLASGGSVDVVNLGSVDLGDAITKPPARAFAGGLDPVGRQVVKADVPAEASRRARRLAGRERAREQARQQRRRRTGVSSLSSPGAAGSTRRPLPANGARLSSDGSRIRSRRLQVRS